VRVSEILQLLEFGAVVLFSRTNQLHDANTLKCYCVLKNPHAYRRPPEALFDKITHLDEGGVPAILDAQRTASAEAKHS
jgi:hypothetical protein